LVFLGLTRLACATTDADTALLEPVSTMLATRLATSSLVIDGRLLPGHLLARVYASRRFMPLWIEPEREALSASAAPATRLHLSAAGVALRSVLAAAEVEGLDRADYYPAQIERRAVMSTVEETAELDILLTAGLVRYVSDLRSGRLAPGHRCGPGHRSAGG
jgi:hypothetical protein